MAKMNPVVHFEMPYTNGERLQKFYSQVFGWHMQPMGEDFGKYILAGTTEVDENMMIKNPGAINGGFYEKGSEGTVPYPSLVIQVDDVRAWMEKVKAEGGKVHGEPQEIPGIGQWVTFDDPEGNRVSMLQPMAR